MKLMTTALGMTALLGLFLSGCCCPHCAAGKVTSLKVGEEKTIILQENATTGYLWEISSPATSVYSVVYNDHIQPENEDGKVGVPGIRKVVVKGEEVGCAPLTLELKRPWEKKEKPVDTSSFTINVTE